MKKNRRNKRKTTKTTRRARRQSRAGSIAATAHSKSDARAAPIVAEPTRADNPDGIGQISVGPGDIGASSDDERDPANDEYNDEYDDECDNGGLEYDDAFCDEAELAAIEEQERAMRIEERQRLVREEELSSREPARVAISSLLASGFSGSAQAVQKEASRVLGFGISIALARAVLDELERAGTAQKSFQRRTPVWQAPHASESVLFQFKPQSRASAVFHGMRNQLQKQVRGQVLKRDGFRCRYCGATSDLEAAHLVPVDALSRVVDLHTAHQPFLMVTLCAEHHRIYDGKMPASLKDPLASHKALLDAAFEEERRLARNRATRREMKAIADVIEEHKREIKVLRNKGDAEQRRIREVIWADLDVKRECELVGVEWGYSEDRWWDDEHALTELAIRTLPLISELVVTTKGFSEHWKFAGWTWNLELRVWTAASGTPPPSTVPPDTYTLLEKHPSIIIERRRAAVAEKILARWETFCDAWKQQTARALAALEKGAVTGSEISKVCDGNWVRSWLLPLGLCSKRQQGARVVYELTQHGKEATKERLAALPEVLLVPLRDPAPVVREATKELPAAPAGLLDRDADAERRIAGHIGALLAGLLARAFPWLSRAAIWSLLRAHNFAPREQ